MTETIDIDAEVEDGEERVTRVTLNVPQARFLAMPHKFRAFVTGYGGGKTWAGCSALGRHFMEFPRINAGYFAPTYPQIRDIFYSTVEEALFPWGFDVKVNQSNKEVGIYRGQIYYGTTICRSMDHPETIVGFKIGQALVDEIDVMKADKAMSAWRKIVARMRYNVEGLRNGIDVTTTPEGFRFVYRQFKEQVIAKPELAPMYGLVQASTYDNAANLPADYIPSMLASYPPQLIAAYINGQFVNLTTGTIYSAFDRKLNNTDDVHVPGEILYVGMDFNVGKMAAITHVLRRQRVMVKRQSGLFAPDDVLRPRAVDEIVNAYDTPDMIKRVKERYWKREGDKYVQTCQIRVYPDSSGSSRKSVDATSTDIKLLQEAGFVVIADRQNPPVKDRINSMNAMFLNALGERQYLVNTKKCPTYTACLEQQPWGENGEPDKETGHDHPNDGAGYFIQYDYGIARRGVRSMDMFTGRPK